MSLCVLVGLEQPVGELDPKVRFRPINSTNRAAEFVAYDLCVELYSLPLTTCDPATGFHPKVCRRSANQYDGPIVDGSQWRRRRGWGTERSSGCCEILLVVLMMVVMVVVV